MTTSVFSSIVFGPVKSRRLGVSLGVNLLPVDSKLCSFDCIYCECGLNREHRFRMPLPALDEVEQALSNRLRQMKDNKEPLDVITFAGNGEPTLHPQFADLIDMTVKMRNSYMPDVKIAVLSNATMLHKPEIVAALRRVDYNIQKLDGADNEMVRWLNCPENTEFSVDRVVEQLKVFNGDVIIQTIFLEGEVGGRFVTNADDESVANWLALLKEIAPLRVMVYTLDRPSPTGGLKKMPLARLREIGEKAKALGFDVLIAG